MISMVASHFFFDNSTAGNAKITAFGDLRTSNFTTRSTAGNATLTTGEVTFPVGGDTNGFIFFNDTSSADHANITVNTGSELSFSPAFFGGGTTSAANATIVNSGHTNFWQQSRGGDATIITNSGGLTRFFGESTGENATLITNAGGIVDISGLGPFS